MKSRTMKAGIELTAMLVSLITTSAMAFDFAGGTGEPNDPYKIATAEQLISIGDDPNLLDKSFVLINDIDLDPNLPGGQVFDRAVIFQFQGSFNGNGYLIKNLVVNTSAGHAGLFGTVAHYGRVENLTLEGFRITCYGYVGSVAGINRGTISTCFSLAHIKGTGLYTGGLVGYNQSGLITHAHSTGTVTGENSVGGLVGRNNGTIQYCSSDSEVSGISTVGGLAGENGGVYGDVGFHGIVKACYASGQVLGEDRVAGLVGYNGYLGEIVHCYATGWVSGQTRTGGLIGVSENGYIESCLWDMQSSGQSFSAAGSGKTTAEMQTRSTFTAWGCDEAWTLEDALDYPRLAWEGFPGQPIVKPEYGGGSGTEQDPYLIYTAGHLNQIGQSHCDWDKHFLLMDNLDMNDLEDEAFYPLGYRTGRNNPLNQPFTGVIDGNDYTVANLSITFESGNNLGFVRFMSAPGSLRRLTLLDPNVEAETSREVGTLVGILQGGEIADCHILGGRIHGDQEVGGFVGRIEDESCLVTDCHFQGTVIGRHTVGGLAGVGGGVLLECSSNAEVTGEYYVGGLIGTNYSTHIAFCDAKGTVTGHYSVGGFTGSNYSGACITDCNSSGHIQGTETGGGFAGTNFGTMVNCISHGPVSGEKYLGALVAYNQGEIEASGATGSVTGSDCLGGLVGTNYGTISICYATGNILAHNLAGGLVAQNLNEGAVYECYATGEVSGDKYVGGLIGYNRHVVSECYALGPVSGMEYVGGLIGRNSGTVSNSFWDIETSGVLESDDGISLTTAEMQNINTYLNVAWDFDTIWSICDRQDYPRLQWEGIECSDE